VRDQSIANWQNRWDRTTKGLATKQFFPIIKDRLTTRIKLTPNFTAIVTAHGKTKAYLHRFKIIESPECPCDGGTKQWITYYMTVSNYRWREKNLHKTCQITRRGQWKKCSSEKTHQTFHTVRKLNRFWETMNPQKGVQISYEQPKHTYDI
jgi:hypothetical protein